MRHVTTIPKSSFDVIPIVSPENRFIPRRFPTRRDNAKVDITG